jgi:hypothetical protein
MATWISHLRIADKLIKDLEIKNHIEFIVGNIAPDSGVPNDDWSSFTPSTDISHWKNVDRNIEYQSFFNEYCKTPNPIGNDFYLGYYIHLVSDDLWNKIIYEKKSEEFKVQLSNDPKFVWTMKKDWYDLDKKYINENQLKTYELFSQIEMFNNKYLDIFSENAFSLKINEINRFYKQRGEDLNRNYMYLHEDEINDYVNKTVETVKLKIV